MRERTAFTCSNLTPPLTKSPDSFIAQAAAQAAAGKPVYDCSKVGAANYPFSVNLPGNLDPQI